MSVRKITNSKLVEAVGLEFSANVLEVNKSSIRLVIGDHKYSLKTPNDFALHNLRLGDKIDIRAKMHGTRVHLELMDIYENGRRLFTNERINNG